MPRSRAALAETIPPLDLAEIEREQERRRYMRDLYAFAKDVLGYRDIADQPHQALCATVTAPQKRKLILYPRGHFKSTIATIAYSLWRIVQEPNIRILVTNAELRNARAFLREIKGHIERNQAFRERFGDLANPDGKWTETEIEVRTRTRSLKEPTIQVSSAGASMVSQHYDLIIGDDVVNRESVTTPEQIEKTITYYRDLLDLLEPHGDLLVIGTRWHYADLYSHLIERAGPEWLVDVRKAVEPDGTVLFPTRFTPSYLADLRRDKGSYEFSAQYLNDPVSDENAVFKRQWLHYYERLPDRTLRYITVDPAISDRDGADYSVVLVGAVDHLGRRYVVEYTRAHLEPKALIDEILRLTAKHRPQAVGIETVAYQKALKYYLMDAMQEARVFCPIVELRPDGQTKEYRIRALQPFYESGAMFHPDGGRANDLEDEMLAFPYGKHDDVLDALAYQLQIMRNAPAHAPDPSEGPNPLTHAVSPFEREERRQAELRRKRRVIY